MLVEVTSPPTVVGDMIILGSSISDNQSRRGTFRCDTRFDARHRKTYLDLGAATVDANQHPRTGAGNAWSVIAADPEAWVGLRADRQSVRDFYGVYRPGDNRDADSVVALEAATGKRVWGFQTVHHDIWDYDVAAEPAYSNSEHSCTRDRNHNQDGDGFCALTVSPEFRSIRYTSGQCRNLTSLAKRHALPNHFRACLLGPLVSRRRYPSSQSYR